MVNAIAHRDYRNHSSVQVMLFSDHLEIWNPGMLPMGWTTEKLKAIHNSFPKKPLLAELMYLAGYIERLGTGTGDIVRLATSAGLREPEFLQEEDIFKAIIYRPFKEQARIYGISLDFEPGNREEIRRLILVLDGEMSRAQIMEKLQLSHR